MYPLHGQIGGQPVGYPELQKQSSKGGNICLNRAVFQSFVVTKRSIFAYADNRRWMWKVGMEHVSMHKSYR